jgi:hypothetical protein
VSEPSLPEKILGIDAALRDAGIPHAFGGALALAYYAEPRATDDIDLNIFLPPAAFDELARALEPLGLATAHARPEAEREGQCRIAWGRTPIDLFFAYDELHEAMRLAARSVPFGEDRLVILAPEHLLVCKATFDRPKDWLDIEQMLVCAEELDEKEIGLWLGRILGAEDRRTRRFAAMRERLLGP